MIWCTWTGTGATVVVGAAVVGAAVLAVVALGVVVLAAFVGLGGGGR